MQLSVSFLQQCVLQMQGTCMSFILDEIESFRFWEEDDYEYEIFFRDQASFWGEIVTLLRVLARMS